MSQTPILIDTIPSFDANENYLFSYIFVFDDGVLIPQVDSQSTAGNCSNFTIEAINVDNTSEKITLASRQPYSRQDFSHSYHSFLIETNATNKLRNGVRWQIKIYIYEVFGILQTSEIANAASIAIGTSNEFYCEEAPKVLISGLDVGGSTSFTNTLNDYNFTSSIEYKVTPETSETTVDYPVKNIANATVRLSTSWSADDLIYEEELSDFSICKIEGIPFNHCVYYLSVYGKTIYGTSFESDAYPILVEISETPIAGLTNGTEDTDSYYFDVSENMQLGGVDVSLKIRNIPNATKYAVRRIREIDIATAHYNIFEDTIVESKAEDSLTDVFICSNTEYVYQLWIFREATGWNIQEEKKIVCNFEYDFLTKYIFYSHPQVPRIIEQVKMIPSTDSSASYTIPTVSVETLGKKYPTIVTVKKGRYAQGTTTIKCIDFDEDTCSISETKNEAMHKELLQYIQEGSAFLLRLANGCIYLIAPTETLEDNAEYDDMIRSLSLSWTEIGDAWNLDDLINNNLFGIDYGTGTGSYAKYNIPGVEWKSKNV